MKKITLLLSFVACAMFAQGQKLLIENFDYNSGTALVGLGSWLQEGTVTTNPLNISDKSITFPNYPNSGVGQELSLTTSGQDVTKVFSKQTTGSIYFSVLVNLSAAQATGDYFIHLADSASTPAFFARTFAKLSEGKIAFGILNASGGTYSPTYSQSIYEINTNYLIVVKIDVTTGASSLIINPDLSVEPTSGWINSTSTASGGVGGTTIPTKGFSRINIRQGTAANAPTLKLDGIRVAKTWETLFDSSPVTGLNTTKESKLELIVSGKNLLVKNVVEGSEVEIFSAVGSKVQTSAVTNGKVSIANLKSGMYVVRSGKLTQKIML